MSFSSYRTVLVTLTLMLAVLSSGLPVAQAQDAATLTSRHALLRPKLVNNQFKRPLHLESAENKGMLKGDIYAQIDRPYDAIAQSLQGTDHWCDILILHLNVKGCRALTSGAAETLAVHIGRKFDQPLSEAHEFQFLYNVLVAHANYFQVGLQSKKGPLGTSDYSVMLEVVELDANRSFLHLSYEYRYGIVASVAMRSYLATAGRSKVGFSTAGRKANGQPVFLGGVRGVTERNTMRYYLAIESYLAAPGTSTQQIEKRLNAWHTDVEQYPLQLHEMERAEYLQMKLKELARQQAPPTLLAAAR